jgi:hypothetical protein
LCREVNERRIPSFIDIYDAFYASIEARHHNALYKLIKIFSDYVFIMKFVLNKFSCVLFCTFGILTASFPVTAEAPKHSLSTLRDGVPTGPPDAILGIAQAFRACEDERKVNVCIGAYCDGAGKPWIFPFVRAAKEKMLEASGENKEYLPIEGDQAFVEKALKCAYGANAPLDRIAGVQTLSGTGACRIGGEFLATFIRAMTLYSSRQARADGTKVSASGQESKETA